MELLIAFLIAFGVVTTEESKSIKTSSDAEKLVAQNNLDKDYIIWEVEGDDF